MAINIMINASGADLEGRWRQVSPERAVIVTHPHPLYGGAMDNIIVTTIADAYAGRGWSSLCFNFRGVGASSGRYGEGLGEQKDIQGAVDHLTHMGIQRIDLAGYSFGAWVLAEWSRTLSDHPHRITLVSPPVAFMDFDCQTPIPGLHHVITGAHDDIAPADTVRSATANWRPEARLTIVDGADHFFQGQLDHLRDIVKQAV